MRRFWKVAPPLYSDIMGMEAVINLTQGMAVVDDSDGYKPLRLRISDELDPRDPRVIDSRIRTIDIVSGTEGRILEALEQSFSDFDPDFILLSHAPSSTMINSDLDTVADRIRELYKLPVGVVAIDGGKDYLHGISETLFSMGTILLESSCSISRSVNILGANAIDWTQADIDALEEALAAANWSVVSRWGMPETTANLRAAANASVNIVVNISGLKLAQYMEHEFRIPYVVGAPFGASGADELISLLETYETSGLCTPAQEGDPGVLIVGEQLACNALRTALAKRGIGPSRVLSFAEVDRDLMAAGDAKLTSEDDLAAQLESSSVSLVLADPDLAPLAHREIDWIALPNVASQFPIEKTPLVNRFDAALDTWLDAQLKALNR